MTALDLLVLVALLVLLVAIPALLAWLAGPVWAGLWLLGLACCGVAAYIVEKERS